ncbi:MAG: SDR family NAD(P)-dependent oxidoreductase [Acidimicrobiia bacterium]|nr:SDR family NAD(P)-dependent oxidoreductase [Acidimicrobiia bacterium]
MRDVTGWVAVVTGAASGIGRGMARSFTGAGMKVVLADIEQAPLDATTAELADAGHEVLSVPTDVSSLEAVEALAASAVERFGKVNVLCNNAGVGTAGPVQQTSLEDWRWTLAIDLWGPIYGCKVFLPLIEEAGEGHVNSTASMAGLLAGGSLGAYNVAKHGVVALMASLARDLRIAKSPVTASVLCPGPINTNIVRSERNRPAESLAEHVDTPQGERFWQMLTDSLSHGMNPDEVGPMVLDAVRTDKFWVLTHPDMLSIVVDQVERIGRDQSLRVF